MDEKRVTIALLPLGYPLTSGILKPADAFTVFPLKNGRFPKTPIYLASDQIIDIFSPIVMLTCVLALNYQIY
jgi:hypothetical protein